MGDESRSMGLYRRYTMLSPWSKFTLWGSIASVIAIPLSVYFYLKSVRTRELNYCVPIAKTIVFDPLDTTAFVMKHGDESISDRVMAMQVMVWNSGNESIRQENVLETITLAFDPPTKILEARLRQTTRPVSQIAIGLDDLERGAVPLSWKILENGDGCVVQLIYVENAQTELRVNGVIEGQKAPKEFSSMATATSAKSKGMPGRFTGLMPVISLLVIIPSIFIALLLHYLATNVMRWLSPSKPFIKALQLLLLTTLIIGALYWLYREYEWIRAFPPFAL